MPDVLTTTSAAPPATSPREPAADGRLPAPLRIMGANVTPFASYAHAIDCVDGIVRERRKALCVALNPEKIEKARREPSLAELLGRVEVGIVDGIGVAIAARILYGHRLTRITGCDLFQQLAAAAPERGWRVFLLGAAPESNAGAAETLRARHPGLRLVGTQDGYFKDDAAVIDRINASGADLLFVAMGSPKQEYWITEHRTALSPPFCMGVGGSFDVLSGRANRAPKFFRDTGTEFLYRLASDPRRWRRQLALPVFLFRVLAARIRGRA